MVSMTIQHRVLTDIFAYLIHSRLLGSLHAYMLLYWRGGAADVDAAGKKKASCWIWASRVPIVDDSTK